MSRIESAIVLKKLTGMNRYLDHLEIYESVPVEDYRRNWDLQLAVERLIQVIVQTSIDVNFYLLKRVSVDLPKNSIDALARLAELGILERDLATRLSEAVKIRNLITHFYDEIHPDVVHSSIAPVLRNYPRYQRAIIQYLDSLEVKNV